MPGTTYPRTRPGGIHSELRAERAREVQQLTAEHRAPRRLPRHRATGTGGAGTSGTGTAVVVVGAGGVVVVVVVFGVVFGTRGRHRDERGQGHDRHTTHHSRSHVPDAPHDRRLHCPTLGPVQFTVARAPFPVGRAELELLELAGGGAGQLVAELDRLVGHL